MKVYEFENVKLFNKYTKSTRNVNISKLDKLIVMLIVRPATVKTMHKK